MTVEQTEKSLEGHLSELRYRLLVSLLVVLLATGICYILAPRIIAVLLVPVPEKTVVFLGPLDPLLVRLRIAMYAGAIMASPVVLFQAWRFIAPGLTKKERKIGFFFVFFGPFLFLAGALFAFFLLPFSLNFLLGLGGKSFRPTLSADRYFSFLTNIGLTFGLVFELPLISFVLTAIGVLTPAFLQQKKKTVILGLAVLAATVTPPDAFTMMALLLPLIFLYEVSILVSRVVARWRKQDD